jgi:hypothetical protein
MRSSLIGTFIAVLASSAFARSSCHDFSGTYTFIGMCDPAKSLVLPIHNGFSSAVSSIDHRDSFEIQQKDCNTIHIIPFEASDRAVSHSPVSYEVKEYSVGGWQRGSSSVVTIDHKHLLMKYDYWDSFLLFITVVRGISTWNLSIVEGSDNHYKLNVETFTNSLIHYGGSNSISCQLQKTKLGS